MHFHSGMEVYWLELFMHSFMAFHRNFATRAYGSLPTNSRRDFLTKRYPGTKWPTQRLKFTIHNSILLIFLLIFGCWTKNRGFYPPKWMVYFMENPNPMKMGWFGGVFHPSFWFNTHLEYSEYSHHLVWMPHFFPPNPPNLSGPVLRDLGAQLCDLLSRLEPTSPGPKPCWSKPCSLHTPIHPRKLTWNMKTALWKRNNIYKPSVFGFC